MMNKLKICIVGPGIMPIPPTGWGALEILIDDKRKMLEMLGHEVLIVNTPNRQDIVTQVNSFAPDFVHIEYDVFVDLVPFIECKNIALTSQYGYITRQNYWDSDYTRIFSKFLQSPARIFSVSPDIANVYKKYGLPDDRNIVIPNGARDDLFRFEKECTYPDRSIYLAKIEPRKRQHLYQNIQNLYFAGRNADTRFVLNDSRYLGEWDKPTLYSSLTDYANLVLLSDGEAHPLVCVEAMSAGLGLVISEWAAANLDTSLPFIDVIPENRISDIEFVSETIEKNRRQSIGLRQEIRDYCVSNFSWQNIIKKYLENVRS